MVAHYKYGETRPSYAPLKAGVALNICDLSYLDSADGYKIKPASSFSWGTAVDVPATPVPADAGVNIGTGLANSATGVKVSYNYPWGEGQLSAAGSVTPTANAAIKLPAVNMPLGALSKNVYVETSAASGVYGLAAVGHGEQMFIVSYGTGQVPSTTPVTETATLATQQAFAAQFVGCGMQYYDGTNLGYGIKDSRIRYITCGVVEFDCVSATFNANDLVAPDKATGNALLPQQVILVTSPSLAIGRVVHDYASATTKVLVEILPTAKSPNN